MLRLVVTLNDLRYDYFSKNTSLSWEEESNQ